MRGSGRFPTSPSSPCSRRACFNPLHCGAVVASHSDRGFDRKLDLVSIPFIAGQWSLLAETYNVRISDIEFQSPSLRGSGRFRGVGYPLARSPRVSIPFIAGQWSLPFRSKTLGIPNSQKFQSPSLRGSGRFFRSGERTRARRTPRFNPLHCGAVVASWTI